ncbi:MAG: hypothetical protein Kow009_00700 [Spirochaetales bacterium]
MKKKWFLYSFFLAHLVILDLLYNVRVINYLLLHSIIELVAVVVSLALFIIGWETRQIARNHRLLIISVGYLGVAILDTFHTLAYKGMGVFPEASANLPTQLWIAGRYVEAVTFLLFTFLHWKSYSLSPRTLFWGLYALLSILLLSIFLGIFPACFLEGSGLTDFKVGSEYFISVVFLLCAGYLWKRRTELPSRLVKFLVASLLLKVFSEMSFTLYVDVYDILNYLGHIFKFLSVMLIYDALIEENLKDPFQFLFQELAQKNQYLESEIAEKELKRRQIEEERNQKEQLLREVHHRIKNNLASIIGLLQLKMLDTSSEEVKDALQETIHRLTTMSTLYQKLLISTSYEEVSAKEYLEDLLTTMKELYTGATNIHIETRIEPVFMETKRLFLVGVILNELVTNSLKYAFSGKDQGTIQVILENRTDGVHLFVKDNGKGFERSSFKTAAEQKKSTGYGIKLVDMLSSQLGGWASLQSEEGKGTHWEIVFPLTLQPA